MRKLYLLLICICIVLFSTQRSFAQTDIVAIDTLVAEEMSALNIPGLALAVVQGDEILYAQSYGVADPDGTVITLQTPFLLASLSKSFTALAIMQLVEQGAIDLDAPVQQYLPWFRMADEEASAQITVSHLLYHTSGISEYSGYEIQMNGDMSDTALENNVRRLSNSPLNAAPGETFEYSNTNYDILGLIVQTVSGQSYESYIEERIFAPLDMQNSYTSLEEAQANGMSSGYYRFFGFPMLQQTPFSRTGTPSWGIISSADDMAHYLIAHLNEGRYEDTQILSPEGMAQLHQPGTQIEGEDYAMGWNVFPLDDTAQSPTVWGHIGTWSNYRTCMQIIPEEDLGIVVLLNTNDSDITSRFGDLCDSVPALIMGREIPPSVIEEDVIKQNGKWIYLFVALLQIGGVVWAVNNWRRWRQNPTTAPKGTIGWLRAVILPLILDIALFVTILFIIPIVFVVPFTNMMMSAPDYAILSIAILLLSLWGIIRTMLYVSAIQRSKQAVA